MTYIKDGMKNRDLLVEMSVNKPTKYLVGFSLIEVMVALAIISIASLGYIEYELGSRRAEYDAAVRMTASLLALDLSERMRANQSNSTTYGSGGTSSYIFNYTYNTVDTASPGTANPNCLGKGKASCHGNELAVFDIWEWGQYFQSMMPVGSSVAVTNAGTDTLNINIQWPTTNVAGGKNQFSVQVYVY